MKWNIKNGIVLFLFICFVWFLTDCFIASLDTIHSINNINNTRTSVAEATDSSVVRMYFSGGNIGIRTELPTPLFLVFSDN